MKVARGPWHQDARLFSTGRGYAETLVAHGSQACWGGWLAVPKWAFLSPDHRWRKRTFRKAREMATWVAAGEWQLCP